MECFIYRPFGISYASRPSGLCVDPTGYCYVSDTGHGLIRRISVSGHVETVQTAHVLLANGDADGVALREPRGIVADALRLYVGMCLCVTIGLFLCYSCARTYACRSHVIEMAIILSCQGIVSCIESSSSPPPHKLLRRVQERQDSS